MKAAETPNNGNFNPRRTASVETIVDPHRGEESPPPADAM
jgi:hypothetical protein